MKNIYGRLCHNIPHSLKSLTQVTTQSINSIITAQVSILLISTSKTFNSLVTFSYSFDFLFQFRVLLLQLFNDKQETLTFTLMILYQPLTLDKLVPDCDIRNRPALHCIPEGFVVSFHGKTINMNIMKMCATTTTTE